MKRRGKVTAAELLAQLAGDPECQRRRAQQDAEIEALEKILRADEAPLVQGLRGLGFDIESVWDFVNNQPHRVLKRRFLGPYRAAYPVLLGHLRESHHPRIREGIIRALTIDDGGPAIGQALLQELRNEQNQELRWVIANVLRSAQRSTRALADANSMNHSIAAMWRSYLASIGETPESTALTFRAWHFCDNQHDADELASLVLAGNKRATASSLWEYGADPLPKPKDLDIVTFWSGRACCVICTSQIEIKPFREVSAEFAAREGEGDGSLEYWRRVHWAYYERVLQPLTKAPSYDMPVVCQEFEVVYPAGWPRVG